MGTLEMYRKGANVIAWQKPYPQDLVDRFSLWIGYSHEQLVMNTFYSFFGDRHFLENKKTMEAFFKYHRNSEIFTNGRSMTKIFQILYQVHPKTHPHHRQYHL